MNFTYLIIIVFSLLNFSVAQLSIDSTPHSIIEKLNPNVPIFNTPELDIEEIINKDILDLEKGAPYKFGHNFSVDINFFDYAICDTLDNGDRVFRLAISTPNAYSINFIFDYFYLSPETELFIYNDD